MDAVCSVCQRTIKNGLPSHFEGGYMRTRADLVPHPAAGVQIDVKKDGWEKEFDYSIHDHCEGSGMLPEAVLR